MIHRRLAIEAAEKGISMNRLISVRLAIFNCWRRAP
jgi:predicted HicB family RNase H-like nuclease